MPDDSTLVDPLGYEEDASYRRRRAIGLRPIAYADTQVVEKHPDQRGCPHWCWVAEQEPESDGRLFGHNVDSKTPMMARHSMEPLSIVASMYRGKTVRHNNGSEHVMTATIEPTLEQAGQSVPFIDVALRWHGADDSFQYDPHRLRLSLTDAKEMCVALRYLVDLAEGAKDGL